MQPDLLSTQQEENPSEPLPAAVEPEPARVPATEEVEPASAVKQTRPRLSLPKIALGLLVLLLLVSFGWVGYWAYSLSNELTATQGQLAALQGEHDKLKSDYAALVNDKEKLNADLTQTQANLEKATTHLAAAQTDLQNAQNKNDQSKTQMDKAGRLVEILYAWTTVENEFDFLDLDRLINATKDTRLIAKWDSLMKSPSKDGAGQFLEYLMGVIRDNLK